MSAPAPARLNPRLTRLGRGRHAADIGPGLYINEKGYLRYSAGAMRGRYLHRVIMAELCAIFCFYPLSATGLPEGFSVDHVDHDTRHNCVSNLLLLEESIHNAVSRHTQSFRSSCEKNSEEVPF